MLTAITVVVKYVVIVKPPIVDNFDISFKSEIPFISEARINGIAINFKELIKIVPNGLIQLVTNILPTENELSNKPIKIPKTIPIIIFQYKGMFFIVF